MAERYNRFAVDLYLGNDAMQRVDDIARALEDTARKLRAGTLAGKIQDINGNTVGDFGLERVIVDNRGKPQEFIH